MKEYIMYVLFVLVALGQTDWSPEQKKFLETFGGNVHTENHVFAAPPLETDDTVTIELCLKHNGEYYHSVSNNGSALPLKVVRLGDRRIILTQKNYDKLQSLARTEHLGYTMTKECKTVMDSVSILAGGLVLGVVCFFMTYTAPMPKHTPDMSRVSIFTAAMFFIMMMIMGVNFPDFHIRTVIWLVGFIGSGLTLGNGYASAKEWRRRRANLIGPFIA